MKGKIGGIVRQIGAGDELSGSIINPHPLLFNILKSSSAPPPIHTHAYTHTEQSRAAATLPSERSRKRAALTIL